MTVYIISAIVFLLAMLGLAIGLIFGHPCLRGACRHANNPVKSADGESLHCPKCEKEIHKPEVRL